MLSGSYTELDGYRDFSRARGTAVNGKLGIGLNETTPDGRFTLKEGECFGACGDAPVMLVNNKKMVSFMTPEALDRYLAELAK